MYSTSLCKQFLYWTQLNLSITWTDNVFSKQWELKCRSLYSEQMKYSNPGEDWSELINISSYIILYSLIIIWSTSSMYFHWTQLLMDIWWGV